MAQRRGARLEVLGVAAADDNPCAELAEPLRDCQPDAGSAAGDDGDVVLKRAGCKHDVQTIRRRRKADGKRRMAGGLPDI